MAVKIRLARIGSHKKPYYRVVAASSEKSATKKFIEILGTYNPHLNPADFKINKDKFDKWISLGAKPSDTVKSLIRKTSKIGVAN
ncbi:MAG: 30S ribosomal protein S16 [Candidatus Acididesulfobacter diazotrophicus]|uniref:Small ribosomal subunit protein bS16 n=1 Tax=Candidatus Acididesulfobacter diazotrophicus TaxID=2597226 RepID=A0A519BK42_9DELT|nr:MAG: 30S ribosomal protein S16 [Candidatus Acididesulfobacter diazotrophicus]